MRTGSHACALGAAVTVAAILAATVAFAQNRKYDPGASDTEIRIGQTMPSSGPLSSVSAIGKTEAAYTCRGEQAGRVRNAGTNELGASMQCNGLGH
jgi:hypothetical protein